MMTLIQANLAETGYAKPAVLYMALELSQTKWDLWFSEGNRERRVVIPARDVSRLTEEISKAKEKFGLPAETRVKSVYEAGRDGFWIHRLLLSLGVEDQVIDSASIEVERHARRVKTDRVDGRQLLRLLIRQEREGERLRVVRIPTVEEEDARRLHRELERLKQERTQPRNRIRSLLVLQGVEVEWRKEFMAWVATVVLWGGSHLPPQLQADIGREYQRLQGVEQQLRELTGVQREQVQAARVAQTAAPVAMQLVVMLSLLKGIGMTSAWILVRELFGWRRFRNRREVGAAAGLTGTPYDSGQTHRDQGSSKTGNRRIRSLLVELAWCWLRFQPQSALSQWFRDRFGGGGPRQRRIGIVALARRLLIALWRYVQFGEMPPGAELKAG